MSLSPPHSSPFPIDRFDYWHAEQRLSQTFEYPATLCQKLVHQTVPLEDRPHLTEELRKELSTIQMIFLESLFTLKVRLTLELQKSVKMGVPLDKMNVQVIKNLISKAEEGQVTALKELNGKLLAFAAKRENKKISPFALWQISQMASRGWITKGIAYLTASKRTAATFNSIRELLKSASERHFEVSNFPKFQEAIFHSFQTNPSETLADRGGVVRIGDTYRLSYFHTRSALIKQLRSFVAQERSGHVRETIKQEIPFSNQKFTMELVPFNGELDEQILPIPGIFSKLFGLSGISSLNRMEPHLTNAYMVRITKENGEVLLEGVRHGILADLHSQNPLRRIKTSDTRAQELLLAPLLLHTHRQLQGADPAPLHFLSVSLVTPDALRPTLKKMGLMTFNGHGIEDERQMLDDQIAAIRRLQEKPTLFYDSEEDPLPLNLSVYATNFGTNVGAVEHGERIGSAQYQFNLNKEALARLSQTVEVFLETYARFWEIAQAEKIDLKLDGQAIARKKEEVQKILNDINTLSKTPLAYLSYGNQYEIQARLILLMQTMDRAQLPFKNCSSLSIKSSIPSYKWAYNCKENKDRASMLFAVSSALAILHETNGRYIPLEELMKNKQLLEKYCELIILFLQSRNIEITTINTGVKGYKVGKEANVLLRLAKKTGLPNGEPFVPPDFHFDRLVGLSKTTHP